MPCMNSTSAGERGGRAARVEDGSVLVGAPGAPGCTTTGFAESLFCARATGENKTAETVAARNACITTPRAEPSLGIASAQKMNLSSVGWEGETFIWTRSTCCRELSRLRLDSVETESPEPCAPAYYNVLRIDGATQRF